MKARLSQALVLIGCLLAVTSNLRAFRAPDQPPLPDFDRRQERHLAVAGRGADKANAAAHLRTRLPGVRVDLDEVAGLPRVVVACDGFLSGPNGQGRGVSGTAAAEFPASDPHRPLKAFLKEHRALFGHGPEALANARIQREFVTRHNGLRTVVWEQELGGIPVFEGILISHTSRRGELVNVSSQLVPDLERAAPRGGLNRKARSSGPIISAPKAVLLAARNMGEDMEEAGLMARGPAGATAEQRQKFKAAALQGEAEARLVWLPVSADELRLSWHVLLTSRRRGELYRLLVDATTGEVWRRDCLTHYLTPATYRVFTNDSPSPLSPGYPVPLTNQPPLVARSLLAVSALDTNASPSGWINDGDNETRGNNADASWYWRGDEDDITGRVQGTPFRVFDLGLDLTQPPGSYAQAAVVQAFYWCNWMHDRLYQLGFTEAGGNFQNDNFSRGGTGQDAVLAVYYLDSTHTMRNNAWMSTPPDGGTPWMALLVFDGPSPRRASPLDAEVVLHEYAHGLSNRRVGGGIGLSALQSCGLGEGWSDFYALALLSEPGDDVDGSYASGAYLGYRLRPGFEQNYYFGVRRYPYSTDLTKNPLTFKDVDTHQASPHASVPLSPLFSPFAAAYADEVHCQGEVWCVTLWEARANLIKKHGAVAGNELMLQLVTDGLNLAPPNPNFMQARDAILEADWVNTGGANRRELWVAFAKRGLGFSATAPASSTTAGVRESFDLPDDLFIHPGGGFTTRGPVGGPFFPRSQTFVLTDLGAEPLAWTVGNTSVWLSVSLTGGTLAPSGPGVNVTVSLNAAADLLPQGIYPGTVWFTNLSSGVSQSRTVLLRIGQLDYFTEQFAGNNDLDYQCFTFTPDGSTDFYSVCQEAATQFLTDPAGGTVLSLGDDAFQEVRLSGTNEIALYHRRTNVFFIGSNGYLTLDRGATEYTESLNNHFALPRISALYDDLAPDRGGTVSWKELSDRIAVTFEAVPEDFTHNANNFQIELLFDGVIRLTFLQIDAWDGLVGLSQGTRTPANYSVSDFSAYRLCLAPLMVELPHAVTEGAGVLVGQGQVFVPARQTTDTTVNLVSSDAEELTVPASVLIPAGSLSATFDLEVQDDAVVDGTQTTVITASAAGFAEGSDRIAVDDNESALLSVSLPASATEGDSPVSGSVTVNVPPEASVVVSLTSSDPTEVQVPPFVLIPAGQAFTPFSATVVDDQSIDGLQSAVVTARVVNWADGTAPIQVQDNDSARLTVTLPAQAMENDGVKLFGGQVNLAGTLPTNLVVALASSDVTELAVPATATISAGQLAARFDLTLMDDVEIDGRQTVAVTASAPGFTEGTGRMNVYDNEGPALPINPKPMNGAAEVSADVDLAWRTGSAGVIVTNDVYFGTNPAPGLAEYLGSTTNQSWALPRLAPATTYFWQIVARATGESPGPVWQFTTRGVDHFEWAPITSPQHVKLPLGVAITAQDEFNRPVTNFTGSASVSGWIEHSVVLFREDFEDGDFLGWEICPEEYVVAVTQERAAAGQSSLSLSGRSVQCDERASLFFEPAPLTPARITFYVQASATNAQGGSFLLHDGDDESIVFGMGADGLMGLASRQRQVESLRIPYVADRWYQIALVFDWTNHRLAFWVDGQVVDPEVYFDATSDSLEYVALSNDDATQVWFDEIKFVSAPTIASVAVTPADSLQITNGVWTGDIAVLEPADSMYLAVEDSLRRRGVSANFTAVPLEDMGLAISTWPGMAVAGSNLTYTLVASNTGPSLSSGVRITNLLPSAVRLVSMTVTQGVFSVASNQVVFDLGALEPGRVARLELVVCPTQSVTLTNWACLNRIEPEEVLSNNVAVAVTPVYPTIAVGDAWVSEGNLGTRAASFAVTMSGPSDREVTVAYETTDGAGCFGSDYVFQSGTLRFPPGATSNLIQVSICGDIEPEPDEAFSVVLSQATKGFITKATGVGMILNDDNLPGGLSALEWGPVAPVAYAGQPFAALLTARDAAQRVLTGFAGDVSLSGRTDAWTTNLIGTGNWGCAFPMNPRSPDGRSQVIYLASELGGAGQITSLALDALDAGASLDRWTIRMKHSPLASFAGQVWESNGWTVVYQTNLYVSAPGWVSFVFASPFEYNGRDNLMVDFSFYGSGWQYTTHRCRGTAQTSARTLHQDAAGEFGDPLTWHGRTPLPDSIWASVTPNLKLRVQQHLSVPLQPIQASPFVNGVWTDDITVPAPVTILSLVADDLNGHCSVTPAFTVDSVADTDADGLPDRWEIRYFGSTNAPGGGPNGDPDGDELTNWEEFRAGTHPADATSLLRITTVELLGNKIHLSLATVAGKRYQLERADDLSSSAWSAVGENVIGTGELVWVTDVAEATQAGCFYRICVRP